MVRVSTVRLGETYEVKNMNTVIIGVAGGTGSGKSTFTNRLKNYFGDQISVRTEGKDQL